ARQENHGAAPTSCSGSKRRSLNSLKNCLDRWVHFTEADKGCGSSSGKSIKRLADKVLFLEKELAMVSSQRDRALTQNLQLWARVRELELAERQNKSRRVRLHH
ncbi:hypothetical protein ACJU29_21680, partial [Pseudomonas aeruginosa]